MLNGYVNGGVSREQQAWKTTTNTLLCNINNIFLVSGNFSFYFKIIYFIHCKGEKGLYTCSDIICQKASHREESNITKGKTSTESVRSKLMADFYLCSFGDREQDT